MGQRRGPAVLLLALGEGIPRRGSGRGDRVVSGLSGGRGRCDQLSPPSFPPSLPPPVTVPCAGLGVPVSRPQTPTTPGTAGGRWGLQAVLRRRGAGRAGAPRAEVGSVRTGAGAHLSPRGWQGTWPGCWQPDPPAPTLTGASRTASSSWGTAWPRTRRRRASSCRGCTESAGEYGARPAWLLALPLSEVSCPPSPVPAHTRVLQTSLRFR